MALADFITPPRLASQPRLCLPSDVGKLQLIYTQTHQVTAIIIIIVIIIVADASVAASDRRRLLHFP